MATTIGVTKPHMDGYPHFHPKVGIFFAIEIHGIFSRILHVIFLE
jgi:hypothetical protein